MDVTTEEVKVVKAATGFLEEAPGIWSSSRLLAFLFFGAVAVVVIVACVIALTKPSAAVLGSMAGIITALGGCGAIIHSNRNDT